MSSKRQGRRRFNLQAWAANGKISEWAWLKWLREERPGESVERNAEEKGVRRCCSTAKTCSRFTNRPSLSASVGEGVKPHGGRLKTSSTKLPGCQLRLRIEVEPEELQEPLESTYRRLASRVSIPGFRKGKAPRYIVERYVGREAVLKETLNDLIPRLYEQAIKEQRVEPFAEPKFEIIQLEPPIFEVTVPLPPRVEVGDYHAIKVTPEKAEVPEEEIEKALEQLRKSQAYWEPVERPCRLGDVVVLDIEGRVEGEVVVNEKGRWYRLLSESTWPAPGFAHQIMEMNKGEEREFALPLSGDFPQRFAEKECQFKILLREVKEERLPNLDDDFARALDWGVNTLDDLREKVATQLKEAAEQEVKSKLEREALEALVGLSQVEFPPALTEAEVDRLILSQLRRQGWPSLEDYLRNRGQAEEELRRELRPLAEERLTRSLILQKVSELENISVDEAEVEAEIEQLAKGAGERQEELRQALNQSQNKESIRNELLTRKTMERLVEIALKPEDLVE